MVVKLHRFTSALRHYGNPITIGWQRWRGSPQATVVDRLTGLRFTCRRGAERMLGETFHSHVYDVPAVPLRPGDTVVDVGANHGFYSCWAARQGAVVHAFEPDPRTYALLVQNVRRNGLGDRVHCHPEAVGGESGTIDLLCTNRMGGGMSTTVADFARNAAVPVDERVSVPVLSWADVVGRCGPGRVRVCKLDCEGAELGILRSLDATARGGIDAIALEFHPEAYPLADLFGLVIGWGDVQVSKVPDEPGVGNANLNLVRSAVLAAWAAHAAGPAGGGRGPA